MGNIPYDATEDQLTEIFREVGQVNSFKYVHLFLLFLLAKVDFLQHYRLISDANGKPKGFGFCEYKDSETGLTIIVSFLSPFILSFSNQRSPQFEI